MIQFVHNLLQHSLCIGQHIVVPKPQHSIARFGQEIRPPLISLYLIGMVSTIEFKDQFRFRAKEVHDVTSDGLLPAELAAVHLSAAKKHPQLALGVGLVAAEALGAWAKCLCATLQFLLSSVYSVFTIAPGGRGEGEGEVKPIRVSLFSPQTSGIQNLHSSTSWLQSISF